MIHAQRLLLLVTFVALSGSSKAQNANDQAQAIADILTVIDAENAYAAQNCSFYSHLNNLCTIGLGCTGVGLPNYPPSGPDFIESRLASWSPYVESRYLRIFTPGPFVQEPDPFCDQASIVDYCYAAQPRNLNRGRPSFAGTSDGTIYVNASGTNISCPVPVGTETIRWPELTYPVDGATLLASSVTFRWAENNVPVNTFRFLLGSTIGGNDILDSGPIGNATSITVHAIPSDGSPVHASLEYRFADRWQTADATYQARATPSALDTPELLTPTPSSTLANGSAMFDWTPNDTAVTRWRLRIGSKPNGIDYYRSRGRVSDLSAWIDDLPTDGGLVFTRLYYRASDGWSFIDYRHQAAWNVDSPTPSLVLPTPGSDLPASVALFSWTENQTPVKKLWLYAGSERGRNDYFNSGPLTVDSTSVTGLPTAGNPVYVRLWYLSHGRWKHRDFVFGSVDLDSDPTTGGRAARLQRPSRRAR